MTTRAAVGISHKRNPEAAGREAASRALQAAGIEQADFVFLFGTVGFDQATLVKTVFEATKTKALSGCSGEGIVAQNGLSDESSFITAVLVIESDEIRFTNTLATGLSEDSARVGSALGEALRPAITDDTKAIFLFPDGLTMNWNKFVGGLQQSLALDRFLPFYGGTSGDAMEMRKTYQYHDDNVVSDGASCVVLSGNVRLVHGINSGCVPIGKSHTVTRAEGNVLYEIDGKRATDVIREYVSGSDYANWEKTAIAILTLAFKAPAEICKTVDDFVIRYIPSKDDEAGTITLPTEVPLGAEFWMTRRDKEKIYHGVHRVVDQIKEELGGAKPKIMFHFDCAGRGQWIMTDKERTDLLSSVQAKFDPDLPWIGLYTFGEIGPVSTVQHFHNFTLVLVGLY